MKITHILFDMDGLLLATESIYTQVTQEIVSRYGKTFDWSLKSNMIGRPEMDSANYLVDALSLPISAEQYLTERNGMLKQGFSTCEEMPGAKDLVYHLKNHHIPIALASSSSWEMYKIKTQRHRAWFDLFDAVITGDNPNITKGKPEPDVFLYAAQQINANPATTLVFEDAPAGLEAGKAAGMKVVVVPHPQMDKSHFEQADLILNSLTDFDLNFFGLPRWP